MIDCPPPYAADDADSFRCGNGVEVRITADVERNEFWLDAPERTCGKIAWKGKRALQDALDAGYVEVIQAWDARSDSLAEDNAGRVASVVQIDGVDWHVTAVVDGLARIVPRDGYEHGKCPPYIEDLN